ncbi:MAG: amidohydrolase family protein, partial [Nitrososphaerales archaeon]
SSMKPMIEYYRKFYFDTAIGSTPALRCGYEVFGAEKIIFATDYPYGKDGGSFRLATYPKMVRQAGLSPSELELIFEGNVTKLLKL